MKSKRITCLIFVEDTVICSGGAEYLGQRVILPGYVFVHGVVNPPGASSASASASANAKVLYAVKDSQHVWDLIYPIEDQIGLHRDLERLFRVYARGQRCQHEEAIVGLQRFRPGIPATITAGRYEGLPCRVVDTTKDARVRVQIDVGALGCMEHILPPSAVQIEEQNDQTTRSAD